MNDKIKSGKDVIREFFSEISNVEGTDQETIEKMIELYKENKFTDSNIQNVLEELKIAAISKKGQNDG